MWRFGKRCEGMNRKEFVRAALTYIKRFPNPLVLMTHAPWPP
jgi:hypothetical protein